MTKDELRDTSGNRSGTTFGYKVEVRLAYNQPQVIVGRLLDNRWQSLDFNDEVPDGVPRGCDFESRELSGAGCYGYASAQALRWWFHAEADKTFNGICLETRIVKYEIKYEQQWKPLSHHELISGDDRSNTMPDWGKK